MLYPVKITADGDGFMIAFPDIPEALSSAPTKEEALQMAHDALLTAFEFYFEDKRPVPLPTQAAKSQDTVEVPPSLAAKVLLLNEMLAQQVRPSELARMMGTTPQEMNRLTDVHHATKIDSIAAALAKLGKRLELRAV